MVQFVTTIKKFEQQGEKTGWTYIDIPADITGTLMPGNKKSFRVKGKLDKHPVKGVALLPMGGGNFIIPLNSEMRKAIGKKHGAMLTVSLVVDKDKVKLSEEMLACLQDEPKALAQFEKMPPSHQKYYSNWIESAKTAPTKTKRIAMTVTAMLKKQDFGTMMREAKAKK